MPLCYEEIVSHGSLGDPAEGLRRLVLRGSAAATARPGQFLHVRVSDRLEPLLRRPLSIAAIDRAREEVTVLYRVRGRGTEALAQRQPGERLDVLGPLGNGFSLPEKGELWLVAGGIGIFPLYALAQAGLARGLEVRLFWGGESRGFLESAGLGQWSDLRIPLHLSTMDGSLGDKGAVTVPLGGYLKLNQTGPAKESQAARRGRSAEEARAAGSRRSAPGVEATEAEAAGVEALEAEVAGVESAGGKRSAGGCPAGQPPRDLSWAVCGPRGMMQAVAELGVARGFRVEVSLEERMACGVGACLGCCVTVRDERGRRSKRKVCQDGPVFPGREVVWDVTE